MSKDKSNKHSYLYWLIAPFLLIWLVVNYIIGVLRYQPTWANNDTAITSSIPYFHYFEPIERPENGVVTLWFDDAWITQYTKAAPILRDNGYSAALAVPTKSVESLSYVNWAQLHMLQALGWEITNHSLSHDCKMNLWTSKDVDLEYSSSRSRLWEYKLPSDIFVTPCGVDSVSMRVEALRYFKAYRTTEPGFNDVNHLDPYNLKVQNVTNNTTLENVKSWLTQTYDNNYWLILVFHQVTEREEVSNDEEIYSINERQFTEMIEAITEMDIPIAVPSQILAIARDRE